MQTGAKLYEFRHQPSQLIRSRANVKPVKASFISLHAKVIVSDLRRCFIGSLNVDPRALVLNSENGLLIESSELAAELGSFFKEILKPENAYYLSISDDNRVIWWSADKTFSGQPSRGLLQTIGDFFGAFLPIERHL